MVGWALSKEYGSSQGVVRYEIFGEGPPLVLVHVTPFSSYVWRDVVIALAETMRVYAFDLPGCEPTAAATRSAVPLPGKPSTPAGLVGTWSAERPRRLWPPPARSRPTEPCR
jgi:pimeloyl-ACP methyl ester carboxylesterase